MEIYQCCYTHANRKNGAAASSGWETVAVSPDAPQDAVQACARIQNADSPNRPGLLDERGNRLYLTEISGDGAYLYYIKTKYGLSDSLGRPSMFSHGFIFALKDPEILYDPNLFLALDSRDFKDNEEDALWWTGRPRYRDSLDLTAAMKICGLDGPRLAVLARCVYAQMSEERNPKPLYILINNPDKKPDADDQNHENPDENNNINPDIDENPGGDLENNNADLDQERIALLYCVYAVLPSCTRRFLNISTSANAVNLKKNLIFSENALEKEYWLNPKTGENNLLTPRMERRIARYGYPDYAAENLSAFEIPDFLRALDQVAVLFGDPSASNELILKLSCAYLSGLKTASGDTIPEFRRDTPDGLILFDFIRAADMLEDYYNNLNNHIALEKLCELAAVGLSDEELQNNLSAAFRCDLSETALEAFAAAILSEINRREIWLLKETETALNKIIPDGALKIQTDRYWLRKLFDLPTDEAVTRLRELSSLPREMLEASERGRELLSAYQKILEREEWDKFLMTVAEEGVHALSEYNRRMREAFPDEQYEEKLNAARDRFWTLVKFHNFDFDAYSEYTRFQNNSRECKTFLDYGKIAENYKSNYPQANAGNASANGVLLQELYEFLENQMLISSADKREAMNHLYVYLRRQYEERENFLDWMIMAGSAGTEELIKRIKNLYEASNTRFQAERILEEYPKFLNACRHAKNTGYIQSHMPDLLTDACKENDLVENPVPLDLWLRLGENRGRNCFELLDETDAEILNQDPARVVRESELLKQLTYREAAQIYIERKGDISKTVRWLDAGRTSGGDLQRKPGKKGLFAFLKK